MSLLKRLNQELNEEIKENKPVLADKISKTWDSEFEHEFKEYILDALKKFNSTNEEGVKKKVQELSHDYLEREGKRLTSDERLALTTMMEDEILSYGPISKLLKDESVSEVMVNGPKAIYYEKGGRIHKSTYSFTDDNHVRQIIDRIVSPLGRRIDESVPMVDARLPDGSRVNAIIPPLALNGPILTIRKFPSKPFTIQDLIQKETVSQNMAYFLKSAVKSKLNIFISGGTGSGKTSTLNVLSSFIPNNERIITIEDAAELQLNQMHVISLESRPPNIEGEGQITIRDLVRNSLRMRPDRIVVGEVRGAEVLDMLQAMNTGHDGSLSTGHANSTRDLLSRLETMVLLSGVDIPMRAIREQIASSIDLIVQQSRFKDGTRKITSISEVIGLEGDVIVLQEIFTFREEGISSNGKVLGKHVPTGVLPHCMERFEIEGVSLDMSIFRNE